VVGASFAHDSAPPTSNAPATTDEIRTGDDDALIFALAGTESEFENEQGDEDDLAGKAEDDAEVGDLDENDQGEDNDDQGDDHVAPAAPKPAKTHKTKPATHVVASHDDDQGEDNDDQGEDGDHDGSHDGEHDDDGGGHDD
jgi:hypothetical protein